MSLLSERSSTLLETKRLCIENLQRVFLKFKREQVHDFCHVCGTRLRFQNSDHLTDVKLRNGRCGRRTEFELLEPIPRRLIL